jgi:DNA-binding MarR family transcriptional regulator
MTLPDPDRLGVWRAFRTAHAALDKMLTHALDEQDGLQLPWFEVLDALATNEEGAFRFTDLAERVMTNPSSLSRQLDKLEERKLVAREKSVLDDGRAILVVLTPKGHDVWREASFTYYRIVRRAFTNTLTETDVVALHRVFAKVLEAD